MLVSSIVFAGDITGYDMAVSSLVIVGDITRYDMAVSSLVFVGDATGYDMLVCSPVFVWMLLDMTCWSLLLSFHKKNKCSEFRKQNLAFNSLENNE